MLEATIRKYQNRTIEAARWFMRRKGDKANAEILKAESGNTGWTANAHRLQAATTTLN
jgi:hypothetical protein